MTELEILQEMLTTQRSILAAITALKDAQTAPKKEWYSPTEAAALSQTHGVTRYTSWTIRQACNVGRVRGAKKEGSKWLLPYSAVQRLLNHGLDAV